MGDEGLQFLPALLRNDGVVTHLTDGGEWSAEETCVQMSWQPCLDAPRFDGWAEGY